MKHIAKIIDSGHTVFTYDFLQDILKISNYNTLKGIVKSLIKAKIFIVVQSGLRRLSTYNEYELACKIRSPSYISLETVLQKEAVIFQDYSSVVTIITDNTLDKEIDGKKYRFRKIKDSLLLNPMGIIVTRNSAIATKERAICDMLYYASSYYFDNTGTLDTILLHKLIPLYPKKTQQSIYSLIHDNA